MVKIFLIIITIVALICFFSAALWLLAVSRKCQLPDIEDIEVVEEVV